MEFRRALMFSAAFFSTTLAGSVFCSTPEKVFRGYSPLIAPGGGSYVISFMRTEQGWIMNPHSPSEVVLYECGEKCLKDNLNLNRFGVGKPLVAGVPFESISFVGEVVPVKWYREPNQDRFSIAINEIRGIVAILAENEDRVYVLTDQCGVWASRECEQREAQESLRQFESLRSELLGRIKAIEAEDGVR